MIMNYLGVNDKDVMTYVGETFGTQILRVTGVGDYEYEMDGVSRSGDLPLNVDILNKTINIVVRGTNVFISVGA